MTPSLIPDKPQHSRRLQAATLAFLFATVNVACGRSQSGPGRTDSALADQADGTSASVVSVDGPGGTLEDTFKVSPAWLDFGAVDVGASSTPQTVTITVSGLPVAFTPAIAGPGFVLTSSTCTNPQAVDACTLSVRFTPTTIGAASGVLTVGVTSVALSGSGNRGGPAVIFDRIDLGTLLVNQATPVVLPIAPNQPIAVLTCASDSPDLTLASQTCPTTGTIDAPCTVTFIFKAAAAGAKIDSIICTGGGRTIPATVVATVVVAEPPVVSPPSGIFVANVGQTDSVTFTVSNAGSATAGPLTAAVSAGANVFSITSNDCAAPIKPLTSCRITVVYTPVSSDADTGILLVADPSQPTTAVSVTLTSMGPSVPPLTISPTTADFGKVEIGQSSKEFAFTLENCGTITSAALTLTSSAPDFVIDAPSCPALAPNASCTFAVAFTPSTAGAQQAAINAVAPDGALVASTAKVNGEGLVHTTPAQLAMTPPALDFGTLAIDELSEQAFFTVTNTGNTTTGVLSVVKTDDPNFPGGASQFSVVTPCSDALPPGKTCPLSVTYRPTVRGASSAYVTVTDGTLSSTAHNVTGSLAVPSPSALYCNGSWSSSISLGSVLVGQTSEVICTTFNNGTLDGGVLDGGALSITATTSGDFAVTSQGCASSQCTVTLAFKPTAQGVRTAKLTVLVTEGANSSSSTAMLAGKGL